MITVVKGPRGGPQSMGEEDTDFILAYVSDLGTTTMPAVASDSLPEDIFSSMI